jgi:hypothetical protein
MARPTVPVHWVSVKGWPNIGFAAADALLDFMSAALQRAIDEVVILIDRG